MNVGSDSLQSHLGEVKQLGGKAKSSPECGPFTESVNRPPVQTSARVSADVHFVAPVTRARKQDNRNHTVHQCQR
jgi:hypothetical protein